MLICQGLQRNFFLGIQSFNYYVTAARYGFYSNCQQLVSSRQELKEQSNIPFQRQQLLKCLLKAKNIITLPLKGPELQISPAKNSYSREQTQWCTIAHSHKEHPTPSSGALPGYAGVGWGAGLDT